MAASCLLLHRYCHTWIYSVFWCEVQLLLSGKQNLKMSWKPWAVGKRGTVFSIYSLSLSNIFSIESDASGFHSTFLCIFALSSMKRFTTGLGKLEYSLILKNEEILLWYTYICVCIYIKYKNANMHYSENMQLYICIK